MPALQSARPPDSFNIFVFPTCLKYSSNRSGYLIVSLRFFGCRYLLLAPLTIAAVPAAGWGTGHEGVVDRNHPSQVTSQNRHCRLRFRYYQNTDLSGAQGQTENAVLAYFNEPLACPLHDPRPQYPML